jgi:GNAT superfamily N-acetyltransferase
MSAPVKVTIRPLRYADAERCEAIVLGLPEWFGHAGGRAACAEAVRAEEGWVAEVDGRVTGFATWIARTPSSAEITWAAVERDQHGRGVGTQIVEALLDDLRRRGYRLALVMTSAAHKQPVPGPDVYDATRGFWMARGFLPLVELDIWDTDIALLLVRSLAT